MYGFAIWTAGCFYSTAIGELKCYENPKNKVTAFPANEEEIWGAKFKVTLPPFFCSYKLLVADLCNYAYIVL